MKRLVTLTPFLLLMFSASVEAQQDAGTPITVKDDSAFSANERSN